MTSVENSPVSPGSGRVLGIGAVRVEPSLDEIVKDGAIIKLEPRAMRLLMCLADHAGEVVSVDQLLDQVWRDVVVSPDSVYQAIAALRRALGDDPKQPTYIANVMRRGYRLVAPVSRWTASVVDRREEGPVHAGSATALVPARPVEGFAPSTPVAEPASPPALVPPMRPIRTRLVWLGLLLIAAAAAMVGYRSLQPSRLAERGVTAGSDLPAAAPPVTDKSVAVLPFLDMSEKKDEEYFADGISEEIINRLAHVPELHVPARTSSFYFKGKQTTISEVAKSLGVSHILEGSVRKSGDMLRITAQLIRVDSGYHVWSQTFDRPMADVFQVQDDIAGAVVKALEVSMLNPQHWSKPPPTTNPAAYTLYLRARDVEQGADTADFELARKYMQQALVLDPDFALGWAELAQLMLDDLDWGDSARSGVCAPARKAADEALRLGPELAVSHRVMGSSLAYCDWNWTAAELEFKRGLALEPDDSSLLRSYSNFDWVISRTPEQLEFARRAVAHDPLNAWNFFHLSIAQGLSGQYDEAVASMQRAIELSPTSSGFHAILTNALLAAGKPALAMEEIQREPDKQARDMNWPFIYHALGQDRDADAAIEDFKKNFGARDPENVAAYYACRKQADLAIEWLKRTVAQGGLLTETANRRECYKNIEGDPRYQSILRGFNMPK